MTDEQTSHAVAEHATMVIRTVLNEGRSSGRTSLTCKPTSYHIAHAIKHIGEYIETGSLEDLQHALTRIAIVNERELRGSA